MIIENLISVDELSLDLLFQSYVNVYPLLQGLGDYTAADTKEETKESLRLYNGLILHGTMIEEWLKFAFQRLEEKMGKTKGGFQPTGSLYKLPNNALVHEVLGQKWEHYCNQIT